MIAYHGSNHCFQKFRLDKKLVNGQGSLNNEGLGIYFSTDKSVACSYGKYLYTIEINDKNLLDFTKKRTCTIYINRIVRYIYSQTEVNIMPYIMSNTPEYLLCGNIAIYRTGEELKLQLDSNCNFYELGENKINKIFKILETYDKNLKAYLFNYNIPNIGVVKDISENTVRIIDRTKIQ